MFSFHKKFAYNQSEFSELIKENPTEEMFTNHFIYSTIMNLETFVQDNWIDKNTIQVNNPIGIFPNLTTDGIIYHAHMHIISTDELARLKELSQSIESIFKEYDIESNIPNELKNILTNNTNNNG